jgi:Na+-transporting methylmalonyl-CoA/oxaloacetate decarboxylase gamma subunit
MASEGDANDHRRGSGCRVCPIERGIVVLHAVVTGWLLATVVLGCLLVLVVVAQAMAALVRRRVRSADRTRRQLRSDEAHSRSELMRAS